MQGFLLERLTRNGWNRTGSIYWRISDAKRAAKNLMRTGALSVRILPVSISGEPVAEIPGEGVTA